MSVRITKTTSVVLYGSSTLAELREFIAACDGLPGTSKVSATSYQSRDQRDPSSVTITVNDAR